MTDRAIRRHHAERLKRRVSGYYAGWARRASNPGRVVGMLLNTRTLCSCWCCGNLRHHSGERTRQERKAEADARDQLRNLEARSR